MEDDGDKRIFFGLRDHVTGAATGHIIRFHYSVQGTSRASSLASFTLSPPRLTADVRSRQSTMQPRIDLPTWVSLYRSEMGDAPCPIHRPTETVMEVVRREVEIGDLRSDPKGVPVDYLLFGRGEPTDPTCTKFGGVPYRSRSLQWPGDKVTRSFEFFGQINFSSSRDLVGDLPSDLLLIFLEWEDAAQTSDFYFEWASVSVEDPITQSELPESPFGVVQQPAYCEFHRSVEFPIDSFSEHDRMRQFSHLSITKIGGVSDYLNSQPPDLQGKHLFTLSTTWMAKGRPFPFLNQQAPTPKPGSFGGHMDQVFMIGDLGEAYFYWDGSAFDVASRCH